MTIDQKQILYGEFNLRMLESGVPRDPHQINAPIYLSGLNPFELNGLVVASSGARQGLFCPNSKWSDVLKFFDIQ